MKILWYYLACILKNSSIKNREVRQPMGSQKTLNTRGITDPMQRPALGCQLVLYPVYIKSKTFPGQRHGDFTCERP